jgi:hypothetical protein
VVASTHLDAGLVGEKIARLADAALAAIDEPSEDQRLGALAALGEAAIDDNLIGTALGLQRVNPLSPSRRRPGPLSRDEQSENGPKSTSG